MLLSSSNCAPLLLENWLVVALWPKKAATQAWPCGHVRMNPVTPSAGGLSLHHRIWRQTQGHGKPRVRKPIALRRHKITATSAVDSCVWESQGHGNLATGALRSTVAQSWLSRVRKQIAPGRLSRLCGSVVPGGMPHDAMTAWTTPAGRCCVSGPMAGEVYCVPLEQKRRAPQGVPKGAHGSFMA